MSQPTKEQEREWKAQALESVTAHLVEPARQQFESLGLAEAAAALAGLKADIAAYAADVREGIADL
jgi:hypothetical protein